MTDEISNDNRAILLTFVKDVKTTFQSLLEAAAISASLNSRNKSATSIAFTFATARLYEFIKREIISKKTLKYRQDKKRFNVHIDVHYENLMNHYNLVTHCNVLMSENKHRVFKKNVYNTNFVHVERSLLLRENMQQIIRLLFLKTFKTTESQLTQMIENVYQICSTIFNSFLSKSK